MWRFFHWLIFGYAILQQSVDVVVKYKCNVFAYVEGKIVACDCQWVVEKYFFFLQKFSSSGFFLYRIHPVQMIWFMWSRTTFSALVLIWGFESRHLAFYMAYYAPSVEENCGQNKCVCICVLVRFSSAFVFHSCYFFLHVGFCTV